jgi:hypothetical protein
MNIQNTLTILYTFILLSLLMLIFVNAGIFGKMVALIVGTAYLMDSEQYEGGGGGEGEGEGGDGGGGEGGKQRGMLILAPPRSGKSYWIKRHLESGWKEGGDLYPKKFIHKKRTINDLKELDKANNELKAQGHKVITGDWWQLDNFDAIVLPPLDILQDRLKGEERPNHDPAKADELIRKFNKPIGLPIFKSIDEAVEALDGKIF